MGHDFLVCDVCEEIEHRNYSYTCYNCFTYLCTNCFREIPAFMISEDRKLSECSQCTGKREHIDPSNKTLFKYLLNKTDISVVDLTKEFIEKNAQEHTEQKVEYVNDDE